ncbi:MAG TPA: hypothetical protein VNJ49_00605 [Bradyrhizobium sp.]|nr:hypothetical protein [Bradyrhizobium sp.]
MIKCYSYRQSCELGLVPPRTPERADAQVPHDPATRKVRYGRIGHFYFYEEGTDDDPAFGLIQIEISAQYLGGDRVLLEAYSIGDGYQSCRGSGRHAPLTIELHNPDGVVASAQWAYSDILCGHADALTLSVELSLLEAKFDSIERAVLPPITGCAELCG